MGNGKLAPEPVSFTVSPDVEDPLLGGIEPGSDEQPAATMTAAATVSKGVLEQRIMMVPMSLGVGEGEFAFFVFGDILQAMSRRSWANSFNAVRDRRQPTASALVRKLTPNNFTDTLETPNQR
jgi:hypothetical protein